MIMEYFVNGSVDENSNGKICAPAGQEFLNNSMI